MTSPSPSASQTFKNNELLINYHDAVIYGWELKLIERRTDWLNDSCIHFFFTHLQQLYPLSKTTTVPPATRRPSFLFMDPSVVSFWMHQCVDRDEIDDFVNNTLFPGTGNVSDGTIFIAVNDKMSPKSSPISLDSDWQVSGGGNHWSLLMIEVRKSGNEISTRNLRFWHFDSIRNSGNLQAAQDIAAKISLHVYPGAPILSATKSPKSDSNKTSGGMIHQAQTPQQENGYDCGVHVLGAAKILSKHVSMAVNDNDIGSCDSQNCRPTDLEECLRRDIGTINPQNFCTILRNEISSEIRRIYKESK